MLSFDYHCLLSLLVIITLKNENKKALLTAKISNALCIYYNPIRKPLGLFRIIVSDSLLSFCYQIVLWRTANPHKYWVSYTFKIIPTPFLGYSHGWYGIQNTSYMVVNLIYLTLIFAFTSFLCTCRVPQNQVSHSYQYLQDNRRKTLLS